MHGWLEGIIQGLLLGLFFYLPLTAGKKARTGVCVWFGKLGCIATGVGLPGEHSGFRVYTFRDRIMRLLRGPGVPDNEFWALA